MKQKQWSLELSFWKVPQSTEKTKVPAAPTDEEMEVQYPGPSAVHDALFKVGKPPFHYLNDRKQVSRTEFIEQFIDGYAEVVRKSIPSVKKKSLYYKIALGLTVGFSLLLLLIAVLVVSL